MNAPATVALDPAVRAAVRGALSILFLWAAAHKLRDVAAFRAATAEYRLLPDVLVGAVSTVLIGAELLVGITLISTSSDLPGFGAAALLSLYTTAIAVNLGRRRHIDCGCAGPAARRPLSGGLLVRNALLLAPALAAALPSTPRALTWIDAVTVIGCIGVMCLLYTTFDTLLANASGLADLRRRDDPHLLLRDSALSRLPPGEAG